MHPIDELVHLVQDPYGFEQSPGAHRRPLTDEQRARVRALLKQILDEAVQ